MVLVILRVSLRVFYLTLTVTLPPLAVKVANENCPHLNGADKGKLLELLQKYEECFDGTLGEWKTSPAKLELKEGVTPYSGRAYPVPRIHRDVFKREIDRLVKLGVLKREDDSEWGSPTFIVPKN